MLNDCVKRITGLELEKEERCDIEYFVVVDEINLEHGMSSEVYGIMISLSSFNENCKNVIEKSVMRGITVSQNKIFSLIRLMWENSVTPSTLDDIVRDFMAS